MEKQIIISLDEYRRFRALEKRVSKGDEQIKIKFYYYNRGTHYRYFTIMSKDETIKLLKDKIKEIEMLQVQSNIYQSRLWEIKDIVYSKLSNKIYRANKERFNRILRLCKT